MTLAVLNTRARKTKPRKCRLCREEYKPTMDGQEVCSWGCGLQLTREREIKALKRKAVEFNRETRERKQAIKTRSKWMQETQREFNRYIRARDAHLPCISCGLYNSEPIGGQVWDCGHYKPTGSHPELRLNPFNAHRLHSRCNRGAAKSGQNDKTVSQQYRENLVNRIGIEMVEWLEAKHEPLKPTIDELIFLKAYYREQAKILERAQE